MIGRMCVVLGLVLLGAMCFPAFADASCNANANSYLFSNVQEDALSAESVVSVELGKQYHLAPLAINEAATHQKADEQAKIAATGKPNDNLIAGLFRRRNGEPRTPLRSVFRGGGGLRGCG